MEEHVHSEFSSIAIDHARSPRNMGIMPVFDGHGSVAGSCGDSMDMWIRVQDDEIVDARFATDGCGSSIACGSMTTELARSRSLAGIAMLCPKDVLEALAGFPDESAHCAELAVDALKAACQDYFRSIPMGGISRKFLVVSGKGGVGKTTVAVHLARRLRNSGAKVGLLDADIHGPSVPSLLGTGPVFLEKNGDRLMAHDHAGIKVVSMGFLVPDLDRAVTLRGPRKTMLVRQFLREVDWGDIDAMVVDTPPGTGDELLTVVKSAGPIEGAIVVATPQEVSIVGARRAIAFCREMDVPVIGVLENMAGVRCAHCGNSTGGGWATRKMTEELGVPFLGSLPTDPRQGGADSQEFDLALGAILDEVLSRQAAN